MSLTTDDLFILIGQKEARISELNKNFTMCQQDNVKLQEQAVKLKSEYVEMTTKLKAFESVKCADKPKGKAKK